jgi:hypothetical protein
MAMGTPAAIYHGGLLHASVRYFDPQGRRPGLPEGVAALVERITPEGIVLTLVNTDALAPRDVLVQAGAFGEHRFTAVRPEGADPDVAPIAIDAKVFRVRLGPWAQARLHVAMERFVGVPSYAYPAWD